MVLKKAGNFGVTDGSVPNPSTVVVPAGQAAPTQADIEAWQKKDLEARTDIMLLLEDQQLQLVRQAKTANEMWKLLQQQYQQTNVVSPVLLHKKLNEIIMSSYPTTEAFLNAWQKANDDLLIAGLTLPQEIQVTTLLAALPDSWRPFITTHSNNNALTVNERVALIRQEDQLRGNNNIPTPTNAGPNMAMAAGGIRFRARFRPGQTSNGGGSRTVCRPTNSNRPFRSNGRGMQSRNGRNFNPNYRGNNYDPASNPNLLGTNCNRRGHLAFECRMGQRNRAQNSRSRNQANLTEIATTEVEEDVTTLRLFVATSNPIASDLSWYLDTGATHNMTGTQSWLHNYRPLLNTMEVRLGDDGAYTAQGVGSVSLKLPNGAITRIHNVYYIPGLAKNLLSVSEVTQNGSSIEFHHRYCIIKAAIRGQPRLHVICAQQGRLYPLGVSAVPPVMQSNAVISRDESIRSTLLWHYRLGHPHVQAMRTLLLYKMARGIEFTQVSIDLCEACIFGKMSRTKFPRSTHRTNQPLELVHSDVFGPLPIKSLTGNSYVLLFMDDYSKYTIIFFLKHKSETFHCFQRYHNLTERQTSHALKVLRTDNGGEYLSHEFRDYFLQHGILHQLTIAHTPQKNGAAEWKGRSLFNSSRSMLQVAALPQSYWEEALATACYLQNRLPSRTLPNLTPYTRWTGEKPDLSHIRIFGTPCYSWVQPVHRNKLDSRAERCLLVGYGERFGVKAYRLYNPTTRKFLFSRDVIFDGDSLLHTPSEASTSSTTNQEASPSNTHTHHGDEQSGILYEERDRAVLNLPPPAAFQLILPNVPPIGRVHSPGGQFQQFVLQQGASFFGVQHIVRALQHGVLCACLPTLAKESPKLPTRLIKGGL
ncbi:hypothetical protein L7F22_022144 [Adiantum nelumboides]|nr:hypothetical protein [Adiantum nelumboides]